MTDSHTRSKTELALRLGYSRNTLYAYMRMDGFPRPDRRGQWNIEACRRFVKKQDGKRRVVPSERDALETELLRKRIHRVDLEISDLDNSRTEEITAKITGDCDLVIDALKSAVWRMPDELSGIFSNLAEPMAIYKRFRAEIRQRFQAAHDALLKIKNQSRARDNVVIPFEKKVVAAA